MERGLWIVQILGLRGQCGEGPLDSSVSLDLGVSVEGPVDSSVSLD